MIWKNYVHSYYAYLDDHIHDMMSHRTGFWEALSYVQSSTTFS